MTLYTKKEAAEMLRISVRTLERLLSTGEIRAIKVGKQVRISDDQVSHYLRSNLMPYYIPKSPNASSGGNGRRKKEPPRIKYVPGMKVV